TGDGVGVERVANVGATGARPAWPGHEVVVFTRLEVGELRLDEPGAEATEDDHRGARRVLEGGGGGGLEVGGVDAGGSALGRVALCQSQLAVLVPGVGHGS